MKPFTIVDKLSYGIMVNWEGETQGETARIYCRGDDLPRKPERLTFHNKTKDFVLTASYDEMSGEVLPKGEDKTVGKYTVKVPADLVISGPKSVRVNFALDKHGYVSCILDLHAVIVLFRSLSSSSHFVILLLRFYSNDCIPLTLFLYFCDDDRFSFSFSTFPHSSLFLFLSFSAHFRCLFVQSAQLMEEITTPEEPG